MKQPFKIMFVHGIGFHETPAALREWEAEWSTSITHSTQSQGIDFQFHPPLGADRLPGEDGKQGEDPGILYYEEVIASVPPPGPAEYASAVASLIKSYITTKVGDFFNRERGLFNIPPELEWKAREVAAWVVNDPLRAKLRRHVAKEIREKDPDIVVAHSYGGLITYDAFLLEDKDLFANRYYVTLGTQIGNPLVRKE